MPNHKFSILRQFFVGNTKTAKQRQRANGFRRTLAMESLEQRQMLSITPLQSVSWAEDTGEKPQSKVFEYANQWWTVMPNSSGTWVFRLNGTSWTANQQITTNRSVHADVKLDGDLAHVLLFNGTGSQLASLQYDAADNRFEPWTLRPQLVNVPLSSSVETATIDVDSTGRMWIASDASSTVEVRYSDGLYSSWSAPITVGSNITSDDISAVIAMPNHSIGVFWSNQNSDRFGFRVHQDGAPPTAWSADEVPASQSALSKGGGMADDHVHVAVASDGTLYAAVKTSYDSSGYPKIALLVRRPNGVWDNLYSVDGSGTRPIVVLDEVAGKVIVAYTSSDGGGNILYRESPLGNISLGPRQTMISGSENNVTSTKSTSTNKIVFLAGSKGALLTYDTAPPPPVVNLAPVANAGPDLSGVVGSLMALDATVSDDGLPSPPSLVTSWTKFSGPGTATFGNSALVDTTATFSTAGTYVLRLTANDGQLSGSDSVTVIVADPQLPPPPVVNLAPVVNAGPDLSGVVGSLMALDATVSDDGLPSPPSLVTSWTKFSGPGTATFGNSALVDTTATFGAAGTYVLRLTANDGQLSSSDNVTVTIADVQPPPPPTSSNPVQIAFQDGLFPSVSYAGTSDTWLDSGSTSTNRGGSQTINVDGSPDNAALLKWNISAIPAGSVIVSAAIELNVTNSTGDHYEIYSLQRAWDELSATWQRYAAGLNWSDAGATGAADRSTTVLGKIGPASTGIQRIALNVAGVAAVQAWLNNPLANYGIILQNYSVSDGVDFSSSETSTASLRPKLIISYQPNLAPLVEAGTNQTIQFGTTATLSATVSDDGKPVGNLLTILWTMVSGPGAVTFGSANLPSTTAQFSTVGVHKLRITVSDGLLSAFDELDISVV